MCSARSRPAPARDSPGPNSTIALKITRSGKTVFSAPNVNTKSGVTVRGLRRGTYTATWTLIDANGDTRTATTQFIQQR